ncbi:MAG: GNAT family N-acetyltransferase [Bosea sp. (in: a-proteobacteria)]
MKIEIRDGPESKAEVGQLFASVYPEHILESMVWRKIASASASSRVVMLDVNNDIVAAAGLIFRNGLIDQCAVKIAGVGGAMVSPELQRQGHGKTVMRAAHDFLRSMPDIQFGLLFCEQHNIAFYEGLGWQRFSGEVQVGQPAGKIVYNIMETMTFGLAATAPISGSIDLCGRPW